MAEPGPIPAPGAEIEHLEASTEVRSKLASRKSSTPEIVPQVDRKFDRQPVFLVMTSGQIESAEVHIV